MAKKTTEKKSPSKPAATKSGYEVRAGETPKSEGARPGGVRAAGRGYE